MWRYSFLISASLLALSAFTFARARDDGKHVSVGPQDKPIMKYRHGDDVIKPYVEHLATPAGVNVLRDSPHDHKHHHGLMFAVSVDDVNFWEEFNSFGREVGRKIMPFQSQSPDREGLRQRIEWIGPKDPKPLLMETRTVTIEHIASKEATLLTWHTELRLPAGKKTARISGSPYFGLGMRFLESMDKDGRFINADGKTGTKETNKERSKWCAYSALADGKPVTIAVFDHPDNLRYPATWYTMETPFAYLAATLDLKNQPIDMHPDKPLSLRYGVALWDGTPEPTEINKLHEVWTVLTQRQGLSSKSPSPGSRPSGLPHQ